MTPTRIASYVSLPLVGLLAAVSHYGARSASWQLAMGADYDTGTLSIITSIAGLVGAVLAAGVGALAGGAATATVGLLLMAVGQVMVGSGAVLTGAVVASVGRALVTIGLLSAALRAVAPRAASFRLALLFAAYLATNVGALGAGILGSFITNMVGGAVTQFAFASLTGVTFLLSLPLTILSFLSPPEDDAEPTLPASALPISFIVAGLGAVAWIAWECAIDLQWALFSEFGADTTWIFSVNPVVVAVFSLVGIVVAVGCGMFGVQLPPVFVAGVGLLLLAASLVLSPAVSPFGTSALVGLQVLSAVAEPLAFVGLYVAASTGLSWRITPAAIAILQVGVVLGSLLSNLVPPLGALGAWGAAAGGLLVGLIGAGAIAATWPVRRLLEEESQAPITPP